MTYTLNTSTERTIVVGILLLAAALRVIAASVIPDQSQTLPDILDYRDSAEHFLKTGLMINPYQMPLYPLLIAIAGPGVGQLGADIALSVVSVWLAYRLSNQLFADQRARIFTAAAAACYPPLVFFSVVGLSETLFITLILSAFLYWYRNRFTLAAIFAVLAILTRPIFDVFAPGLVLLFALLVHRLPLVKALQHLAIYLTVYCALMAPWWLNNYKVYGSFVRLTLGAGIVLYAGNNPLNRSGGGSLGVDYDLSDFASITDPVKHDAALRDAAINYIVRNPKRFLELAALKFQRTWQIWPVNKAFRNFSAVIISTASFVPIVLLASLGMFVERRRLRQLSPILLFALGYTGVLMILVGTIRYRLPLEPFMIVLAGAGASYLMQNVMSSRSRPT